MQMAIMSLKERFSESLDKMKLTDKYPQKLSLRDAMTIRQGTLGSVHTTDQLAVLPYLILQKMMMCDQRCRSCLYKESSSGSGLHPVDCMLAVLHCCDNFLRHELFSKLSFCQLAIPFLLPDPTGGQATFLLWAMRSLVKSWRSHKTGKKEYRLVNYQGPIISFLRIGKSQSSKSEILNAIIGEGVQYFFNRKYCEGGDCERHFVDGLVEMCCYLPSGEDSDCFTDAVTFLNLRGDAQEHFEQVEFLQTISFMSVVLIAKENINEDTIIELQRLMEFTEKGEIILLLAEGVAQTEVKEFDSTKLELLHQALPEGRWIKVELMNKDIAMIAAEIQKVIRSKVDSALSERFMSINNCYEDGYAVDFNVDEDSDDCKMGNWDAKEVMTQLESAQFDKNKLLPLQGPSLWQQWAEHDKTQHSIEENTITESAVKLDVEKKEIRQRQFIECTKLTPVMDSFVKHLQKKDVKRRRYFLQWLKLLLDDHFRKVLPKFLDQERRGQLFASRQNKPSEDESHIKELQNKKVVDALFGLKHLFREMGQIYEAQMNSGAASEILKDEVELFPQIMAEIMDEGHALELMDGDASHVPTLWVMAVIEKLKAVCGRNAREKNGGKIFILSVLGLQSTGKSTLLNTMFGLCFNVDRCTRGAYIQLLPLDDSLRQMIDCDYVLIVDTEGLRAPPELQLEGVKRDSELATFATGLADATIINIFGQTLGDLEGALQRSLHAFIRMRGQLEINPTCLFACQNTSDSEKIAPIPERLDTMTQVYAKVENCEGQYNSFNKVIIDFDKDKDVVCFLLWKGDPPMAPVNIGYSEAAQTLKTALIQLMQRKQTCRGSLEAFKLRMKDLWTGVIQNSLQVSVYIELESEYAQWSAMLRSEMMKWEKETEEKLNSCDTKQERIEDVLQMCFGKAKEILDKTYKTVTSFINKSSYSDILLQWKKKTKERLEELYHRSIEHVREHVREQARKKVVITEIESKKIKDCVMNLIDKDYEDNDLEREFKAYWEEWLKEGNIDDDPLLKEKNLRQFKNEYEILKDTKKRVERLCGSIKNSITEGVEKEIVDAIQKHIPALENKRACNKDLLKGLANENNFDSYKKYLLNTLQYIYDQIEAYIEKHYSSISDKVTGPVQHTISKIKQQVEDVVRDLREENISDIDTWITEFAKRLKNISLPIRSIIEMVGVCNVDNLSTVFSKVFKGITDQLEEKYSTETKLFLTELDHRGSSPVKKLYKRLIGCSEMCPLCRALCQADAGHEGDHSVKFHRPACLGRRKWKPTYKLALTACTELVADNYVFQPNDGNDSLELSQYKEWYSDWNMDNTSCGDPAYWKWVICQHEAKFITLFGAKGADIPPEWTDIKEEDALKSAEHLY